MTSSDSMHSFMSIEPRHTTLRKTWCRFWQLMMSNNVFMIIQLANNCTRFAGCDGDVKEGRGIRYSRTLHPYESSSTERWPRYQKHSWLGVTIRPWCFAHILNNRNCTRCVKNNTLNYTNSSSSPNFTFFVKLPKFCFLFEVFRRDFPIFFVATVGGSIVLGALYKIARSIRI